MSEEKKNVLRLSDITMQFGGVVAVNDLSLEINEGEIVSIIGPNGAGKTTAFNVITGVYEPTNGEVDFMGKPIARNHPHGKMKKLYAGEDKDKYTSKPEHGKTVVTLTCKSLARFVELKADGGDAKFSDNFFSLSAGDKKEIVCDRCVDSVKIRSVFDSY